jgi:hypothetical protein
MMDVKHRGFRRPLEDRTLIKDLMLHPDANILEQRLVQDFLEVQQEAAAQRNRAWG